MAAQKQSGRPLAEFKKGTTVTFHDKMAKKGGLNMPTRGKYVLVASPGKSFAAGFTPALSPAQMLKMGVFEGKYINDCASEFPREWFEDARARGKLCAAPDPAVNFFGVKSRQPIGAWRANGWIPAAEGDFDARGWFQWYCRYWLGRRMPAVDAKQIARWRSFARHAGQIRASKDYKPAATVAQKKAHRPRQRQALLQWAYNPLI